MIILFLSVLMLRRLKMIKLPFGGVEYSQVIFVCSTLFGVLFIATAEVPAIFQTFKTLQNQSTGITQPLAAKSAQFFVVILFFEMLLVGLVFLCSKVFSWLEKGVKEIENGNLPFSLFTSTIIIGFSIVLKIMAAEIIEYITPHYLNFR
ncbi:MAG: hypothetical protein WDO71_12845 [Bacteroidota bacterium]